jgi:hypothetical protein
MDLQLIREGEMERERLQKEGFNMKLRINFLEEQLLKYKEGVNSAMLGISSTMH